MHLCLKQTETDILAFHKPENPLTWRPHEWMWYQCTDQCLEVKHSACTHAHTHTHLTMLKKVTPSFCEKHCNFMQNYYKIRTQILNSVPGSDLSMSDWCGIFKAAAGTDIRDQDNSHIQYLRRGDTSIIHSKMSFVISWQHINLSHFHKITSRSPVVRR